MKRKSGEPTRAPVVNWYDPRQLLRTGVEVAVTTLFGKRADSRRVSALGAAEPVFEAPQHTGALWLDFAADTGDGFNATFAVARALASDLAVTDEQGETWKLPSGQLLVLGGDEVYPTPSDDGYERRFLTPFRHAAPSGAKAALAKHVYAIPGNHDWYDGLIEFSRVFSEREQIGPWQTQQNRSYFALRLSPRLWLLGLDTQVSQDIDRDQLSYFRGLLERWGTERDKPLQVVVVTPEPHWEQVDWVEGRMPPLQRVDVYREHKPILLGKLLAELEQHGVAVVLQITGDLHHYRHYATEDGRRHLVTAGGGGAFTHPTHTRITDNPKRYRTDQHGTPRPDFYVWQPHDFPSPAESRQLSWLNLAFVWYNPWFIAVLGAVYLALGLVMPAPTATSLRTLGSDTVRSLVLADPGALLVVLGVIAAVVLFTDTSNKRYKKVAGSCHAIVQLTAALLVAWALRDVRPGPAEPLLWKLVVNQLLYCLLTVGLGGIVGSTLWGAYLFISVRFFGRHSNEAFSSLHLEDYKCFVRMSVSDDKLTLFPLGLRRTPRSWRWDPQANTWFPGQEPTWHLLEPPIEIALRGSADG